MRRHSPGTTWMLHLLGTINGEHEIFQPNFKPAVKPPGEGLQPNMVTMSRPGFLDVQEPLSGKDARGKCSISFLGKKERVAQQIALLKQRQEAANAMLHKKEAQLALLEEDGNDDEFQGNIKISVRDYEMLQHFKLQRAAQVPLSEQPL